MTNGSRFCGLKVFGLDLHFTASGRGSGFAGAAWRGLMGQALFGAVCSFPEPACATCPALAACAYPKLFKPLADTALPPFWLHGWQRGHAGWSVGIRWLGAGSGFAVGEWLAALSAGGTNLSFDGAPAQLEHATAPATARRAWRRGEGWVSMPVALELTNGQPPSSACRVRFVSPLVSKHVGDPLYGALHTRLQRLVQQYGDGAELPRLAQPWRCEVLAQKAKRIPLARRMLTGTEWELELNEVHPDAWPMLRAGIELHAGGQTGMGCGQYEILAAAEP
ncbi:hypothetical protein [Candidatus Accumulibacter sp. ACC012]|uniref:hypothetical protein n=1 Tax=Candidatus Accumulibacter sp. ACC012 TaxID=2823332 RepID=UPI0025C5DA0B|nr:hypothetical protein [Candidatus Accumulibacter sp. ACC012]